MAKKFDQLITSLKHPYQVLEDRTKIVTTPLKPVDIYNMDDVATLFFKVFFYPKYYD